MEKLTENKKMKLEGEKGTGSVEKVEKFETLDVKIKNIGDDPDKNTSPVIGYFPSGYDPLKNSNEPDPASEPKSSVKVYRSVNSRNPRNPRMEVVVGASGSLVNFVGTSYSGEAKTPQLCNYALGVLDKETGVLKLVPIAGNKIFRLEPKVTLPENVDGEKITDLGSYKTKKDIKQAEKLRILRMAQKPGMDGETEQKWKEIEINTKAIEADASAAVERNIPPYDMEATSPDMAFPLDQIILKGDWNYLVDIFELVEAGSDVRRDLYPSFVCNRVHKIGAIEDESKRKRMAGIFSYITHLINYKDKHSMEGVTTSRRRHKLPTILGQKFSSLFSPTKEKRIPDEKEKLLISYVLVLSLFADDFRSDLSDIAKDLRINSYSLRTHYSNLGCKFVKEKNELLATLPVPLQFQTERRTKRKRIK